MSIGIMELDILIGLVGVNKMSRYNGIGHTIVCYLELLYLS